MQVSSVGNWVVAGTDNVIRRGMVDMRKRFRGNYSVTLSSGEKGSDGSYQMYSGSPVLGSNSEGKDDKT